MTSELTDDDCAFERQLLEELAIHVGVERGIVFHEVGAAFHGDRGGGAGDFQLYRERDRDDGADVHILHERRKALHRHGEVIRVERHIGKAERAGLVGGDGAIEAAHRIANLHGGARDGGAGWIGDGAGDGAGVAGLRERGARRQGERRA